MRISWNWLSEWVDLSSLKSAQELADLLTRRGLEVESVERLDRGLEQVISAQILERAPHPQADRLSLCQVSIGSGEPLQIVCGAQNMKAGDRVALAQVGAELPNGAKIGQSKIRGVSSDGMLCSESELKLAEESEGILILSPDTPLGIPLAQILGRNDTVLHLKLTANRGDCLSHLGIAREVASALGQKLKVPTQPELREGGCPVSIHLDAGPLAPQFFGCWIQGVRVGKSPEWLVRRLEAIGVRSINNVVDVSNWVMFELGHPVHAYDADQIRGQKWVVRVARAGEELPLLDHQTIQLSGQELVIADSERPIGLAGVMGGENSEVRETTQNVFLECAEFHPKWVRQAAVRHQRKTEASQRFEKGIDPSFLGQVLSRFASLVVDVAGGQILGSQNVRNSADGAAPLEIRCELFKIHDFLGFDRDQKLLKLETIEEILKSLDCQVTRQESQWIVLPPSYRHDLHLMEDLAEEVARSVGYDAIPATVPPLTSAPIHEVSSRAEVTLMERAQDSLMRQGLQETINFAFSSQDWLARFGMTSSVQLLNPLSEEYRCMVPSLLPGLIRNALGNWHHHFGSEPLPIRLFELRPVFAADGPICAPGLTQTSVQEHWKCAWLMAGPRFAGGLREDQKEIDFYDLKAVLEGLFADLGTRGVRLLPLASSKVEGSALAKLFHPGQSVEVWAGNAIAGYVGLLHPAISKEIKARANLWIAELDWAQLRKLSRGAVQVPAYRPWAEFPGIERDFALVVKSQVTVEKIVQIALKAGKPLVKSAKVFDIYRGSQVAEGMTSVAIRVIFYDETRSLQESEAEIASVRILEGWKRELGAELRG
jgi:phenylalanyl-tRNA synthetase beta chain